MEDASFFLPSGLADDDEENIVLGGGLLNPTTSGLLPAPMWEPMNDPALDNNILVNNSSQQLQQNNLISDNNNSLFGNGNNNNNHSAPPPGMQTDIYSHQNNNNNNNHNNNFDMGTNKNDLMTPYSFSSQQGTARMQATNDFNDTKTNNRYYAPSQPNQNYGNNNNNSNNIDLNQSYLNNDINNNNNLMMNNTTRYREDANKVQYLKPVITQGLNLPMGNKNNHNHPQHHQQQQQQHRYYQNQNHPHHHQQHDNNNNIYNNNKRNISNRNQQRSNNNYNNNNNNSQHRQITKSLSTAPRSNNYNNNSSSSSNNNNSYRSDRQQELLDRHRQRQAQQLQKRTYENEKKIPTRVSKKIHEKSKQQRFPNINNDNIDNSTRFNNNNTNRHQNKYSNNKNHRSTSSNNNKTYQNNNSNSDLKFNNLQYDDDDDSDEDDDDDDDADSENKSNYGDSNNDNSGNTLRKRNSNSSKGKQKSKHSRNKVNKNATTRSPSMSYDDDEDLPSLLRSDQQNRKRSVSSGMHDFAGTMKLGMAIFGTKTISNATAFFFSSSRLLETAFSMLGVMLSFWLIIGIRLIDMVWTIHTAIGKTCAKHSRFGLAYAYIYFFPFVVSYSIPWAPPWGPVCLWYAFLVQLFWPSKADIKNGNYNMYLKWLLPIAFLMEGVSHRSFLLDFTGSQRLLVAFVISSFHSPYDMKNMLFILSFAVQILLASYMDHLLIMQWIQFVIGVNCLGYCYDESL